MVRPFSPVFALLGALTACGAGAVPADVASGPESGGTSNAGGGTSATGSSGLGGSSEGDPGAATKSGGQGGAPDASGVAHAGNGGAEATSMDGGAGQGPGDATSGDYNPCPPKGSPCVVMPLGDSITDGGYIHAGYRSILFHLSLQDHKGLTFVGTQSDGPSTVDNVSFPSHHEGHSGYTIDDGGGRMGISAITPPSLTANKPNIVLLMIGTNDVDIQLDLENTPTRLGKLIDSLLNADPKLLLIVAQIVPSKDDTENARVTAYNAAIPALVKARAVMGKHIRMVDMYGTFTANPDYKSEWMGDNLHPNVTGYAQLANTWYAAIGPLLR